MSSFYLCLNAFYLSLKLNSLGGSDFLPITKGYEVVLILLGTITLELDFNSSNELMIFYC